jgi:anti-sigma factor RsiW
MNCTKCEVLLHALIDGELDAGHTGDGETHVATCSGCTENLKTFGAMREGALELPSDAGGILYIEFNDHVREITPNWRSDFKSAGFQHRPT